MRSAQLVFASLLLAGGQAVAGQDLPTLSAAQLAQRLAEAESRIQDLDVSMTVTSQEFTEALAGVYVNKVRWVFRAPFGTRFRLEQEGMKPWDRGARDTIHQAGILSFDGADSWSLWRFGFTAEELQTARADGKILGGKHAGVDLGEGYRDVLFWRHGKPLSKVVSSSPAVSVESASLEDTGLVYRVVLPLDACEDGRGPETIYLDPARGFSIVRVEIPSRDPSVLGSLLQVAELTMAAPGVWIPVDVVSETWSREYLVSLHRWQANKALVNTDPCEKLFRIDFPAGTNVSDLRTRTSVTGAIVTGGLVSALVLSAIAIRLRRTRSVLRIALRHPHPESTTR